MEQKKTDRQKTRNRTEEKRQKADEKERKMKKEIRDETAAGVMTPLRFYLA